MLFVVKCIAILLIVYGCLVILRPDILKKILEFCMHGNRPYLMAGVKAVMGLLLIILASECRIPWIVFFFGALSLLGGLVTFILKKDAIDKMLQWWENQQPRRLSLMGTISLIMGVLLALAI